MAQTAPLKRYSIGGKAPAVVADYSAGVYGLNGTPVAFDGLFSFARLSAVWKRNALGHWVKVLAGEPRTGHHIWQGGQLVPAGVAICSEVRTNLVRYSEALDVSEHWSLSNNAAVESAGELSGFPAFRLTDANTEGYAQINQTGVTHGDGEHVFQMLVAKDQSPTSQFSIRLVYSVAEVSTASGMTLNVDTGVVVNLWDSNILERNVEDRGDHWFVWFAVDLTGASNILIQLFPAHNNTSGEGGPENVGSHICTAVHLHPGRYPQDYIKTEGAAVSVAAESLQIDSGGLAKAVGVFGPELFSPDDTSDGSSAGGAVSVVGDTITCTNTTGTARATNDLTYEVGEKYLLEFTSSGQPMGVYHGGSLALGTLQDGKNSYLFVAQTDSNQIGFRNFSAGTTGVVSNVTLRKVTMPEELTFLIKGTMTYADEDSSTQVLFSRWLADSNNFIEIRLHTGLPSSTGDPFFLQSSLGAVSSKITNTSPYAPGTEVPFSLGFVLSATEIEGFYNGISTGTAAYGGMANLLSAPLQLFPVGNATIKDFRIWPEALLSADMLEATG
ncbi:hypothetical protein [Pseudophaeobacter sp.]|uniref:phage head spike fiber domain-containing protein n=1 Tax=Pseudophaeobacter sp. TaxID=1971739 RepID=UPI003297FDEC